MSDKPKKSTAKFFIYVHTLWKCRLEHIMFQVFSIMLYFSANRITGYAFPTVSLNYAHSMFPNHAITIAFITFSCHNIAWNIDCV